MTGLCQVIINFLSRPQQYGPFHIPENSPVGTTVTAVLAGDADVRGGDSWQVDYLLESGNEEEVFTLVTDKQTNEVSLVLSKVNNTNPETSEHTLDHHIDYLPHIPRLATKTKIEFRSENPSQVQIKLMC